VIREPDDAAFAQYLGHRALYDLASLLVDDAEDLIERPTPRHPTCLQPVSFSATGLIMVICLAASVAITASPILRSVVQVVLR
jgi:hypothetical protein